MKKSLVITAASVVITATVTWFGSLYLFERPVFGPNVVQGVVESTVLNEGRKYLVHLPETYKQSPDRQYPVIYVTDGSSEDMHTAHSAALMARIGVSPEVIVVGIPNVSGRGRQRDYTPPGMRQDLDADDASEGGADRFLAFLRDELIPVIERDYRVNGTRLLAGNSRGGLFVVYALTAAPGLFDAHIANSPALWRDDGEMVSRLEVWLQRNPAAGGLLFLSLGEDENEKMRTAFDRTVGLLEALGPDSLRWFAQSTPGAVHGNNAELATPVALRWVFDATWKPVAPAPVASP